MTRAAIYARYSSDNQKDASIEDQVRECRERADREGWEVANIYTDHAISGASMFRPGVQQLLQDVMQGRIDVVLTEALDRLSRDQADIATFFKRAEFAGVQIVTLSEGAISTLHIGLKGTMNALYLKDLKDKVKRGQRGVVESGKVVAGLCYGYDVVHRLDERGEKVRGERTINVEQAEVIRRIFRDFVSGLSPKRIAAQLNDDGISGPANKGWSSSTIYGTWQRGSGILNNEMYRGTIVWNKVSYPKNPDTGRHVTKNNPPSEWIRRDAPELRIVDEELWQAARVRLAKTQGSPKPYWQQRRPRHVFSFLLKCGCCGGGMSKISSLMYGCSTARNKGRVLCDNRRNIRQDELETTVFAILQKRLMDPALVELFCNEYAAHLSRLRVEHNATLGANRAELERLRRRERKIVEAILEGYGADALKRESLAVEKRIQELELIVSSEQDKPLLLPKNLARRYQTEVRNLVRAFHEGRSQREAMELIRGLIEKIVLTPDPDSDGLEVNLYGDLAGILKFAMGDGEQSVAEMDLKQIKLFVGIDEFSSTSRRKGKRLGATAQAFAISQQEKLVGPAGLEPATRPL